MADRRRTWAKRNGVIARDTESEAVELPSTPAPAPVSPRVRVLLDRAAEELAKSRQASDLMARLAGHDPQRFNVNAAALRRSHDELLATLRALQELLPTA